MLGESKAKEVIIPVGEHALKMGDEVLVKINPTSGYKAVLMLYLVPFALMMVMLWMVLQFGYQEGIAGLASLLILVPYFSLLYLLKNKLSSQCTIDVEKK
jgi:positive regulator of sigma E activity